MAAVDMTVESRERVGEGKEPILKHQGDVESESEVSGTESKII